MTGTQINFDIASIPNIKCLECGSEYWTRVEMLKLIPKVISPNGQEAVANIPIHVCSNCKTPITMVLDQDEKGDNILV